MVDIVFGVLLILSMVAGYLAGGFRELLKLFCFAATFVLFNIPSIRDAMLSFSGKAMFTGAYFFGFAIFYFLLYKLLFWTMKEAIIQREGSFGKANRMLGIGTGLLRGFAFILFVVYAITFMWTKGILFELTAPCSKSMIFIITQKLISFI